MMKILLTIAGGVLVGPVVGYGVVFPIYCSNSAGCMSELAAMGMSIFVGAPIGAVTFAIIGFWVGYRIDKNSRPSAISSEENANGKHSGNQ